jgi:hypothetical protein
MSVADRDRACACCGGAIDGELYDLRATDKWTTDKPGEPMPPPELVRVHIGAPLACIARALVVLSTPTITVG